MAVFDVYARRRAEDEPAWVGSVIAPDPRLAALLARETLFRRGDAVDAYVVSRDGSDAERHPVAAPETMGGVTDKSYRRADGYVGIGAKAARLRERLAARGLVVRAPRPPEALP